MTECERIIKEGVLPNSFLGEETICDFLVSRERKKIWAINIDMLRIFDSICRKHGLHYSLAFGSLLGVVRHNGFIPWDDDIDVVMPRDDYEKLKLYKSDFTDPYFLQFPGDDYDFFFSFAKLRNSNTSCISFPFRYEKFNQGIFMDIFPMDNYSAINLELNLSRIKGLVAECSALMRRSNPFPDAIDIQKMQGVSAVRDGMTIYKDLDEVLRQYNGLPSDKYIIWCCQIYDYRRMIFPKSLYDELIEAPFYGFPVFIPKHYDKVLTITYGDFNELPPKEARGSWHNSSLFNPDVPYKETLRLLREADSVNHSLNK